MKTAELLKLSEDQYELVLMGLWMDWCASKTYRPEHCQMLASSNPLFKWWRQSLQGLEDEFRVDAFPYRDSMSSADAFKLYMKHVTKLKKYYSSPLIKQALTPQTIEQ